MPMEEMNAEQVKDRLTRGRFAWPGGYPLHFILADGGALCFKCTRDEWEQIKDAIDEGANDQWKIVGAQINWENPELKCDHCKKRIESAFAEDEAPSDPKPV